MVKTILKEAGIVILLLIAIALILGILLYDYIPDKKTVPAKVEAYKFPEDVKAELSETMKNLEQNIVKTLYIDSDDLSLYESKKDYNKGKVNPFAETPKTTTSTTKANLAGGSTTGSGSSTSSTSGNTTSGTGGSSQSTGTFYNKAGKY